MAEPIRSNQFPPHAIAIVGMAGRFPGARGLDEFWRNIRDGVETLETFSDTDLDSAGVPEKLRSNRNYVAKGTVLDACDKFDASFFGYSPREAQIIDPQQRIFLECAWEALEHSGYAGEAITQKKVGVYGGASINTYVSAHVSRNPVVSEAMGGYQLMIGNDKDFLCTRVSYKLGLRGPSLTIQTACSTSLVAVVTACQALFRGECDLALAGGVSLFFPRRGGYLYQEGMIFSPDGHCRPFDKNAQGTRAAEGAGIVVLKRLSEALADRDTIYSVILGSAVNNDGAVKVGFTAPSVDGQAEAIVQAQTQAGIEPRTITYVEAHGTATPLGDPIEVAALTKAFRASTADVGFCRLGSLKANLGHLDVAAGACGLIKTTMALQHRVVPPLVNFREPNPQLELDRSPLTASAEGIAWTTDGAPRRAGVSSFGLGGTNAHVVLEEGPQVTSGSPSSGPELFVVSAKTPSALEQACANLADHLATGKDLSLADVAWTMQVGRQAFAHRRAIVVRDSAEAVERLRLPERAPGSTGLHEGQSRPVVFMFSGQGSQHSGMGADLYDTEKVYRDAVDRCAAILEPHLGSDIRKVIFASQNDTVINETRFAQPALFVTEYALASLWMSWGISPSAMLGHSIGEYVAAHLSGVLSLEDALAVVAARGRLMQALPPGSMAAVHCAAEELTRILGSGVEIAAINAPGLCTVSGPATQVAELLKRLEAKGIDARPLHTSHAFHSSMMQPAVASFTAVLDSIKLSPPKTPYASNVTGTWITPEQATSPAYYGSHMRRAVLFDAGIRTLAADPAALFLEVGPGVALTSLARLALGKERAKHVISSLSHSRENKPSRATMLEALGQLWLAGAKPDWAGVHAGSQPRRVALPTYPFERKRHWVDAAAAPSAKPAPVQPSANAEDWLYAPTWARSDHRAGKKAVLSEAWLVLARPGPVADAVVRRAKEAGADPVLVEYGDRFEIVNDTHLRIRLAEAKDVAAALRHVREAGGSVRKAIYLWNDPGVDSLDHTSTYHALVALVQELTKGGDSRIIVGTFGAASVLSEPINAPTAAIALGPVLTLPIEVPGLVMRAVDLDVNDSEHAAETFVSEAANPDAENVVAWRAGRRWARRFERLSLPSADIAQLPLKSRGVYLVTGGLGGIGVTLARWLAERTSARLLLTARTAIPPREEWEAQLSRRAPNDRIATAIRDIKAIEQAGGEVLTAVADTADVTAMKRAIELARASWGAIDGVIHAAGVPGSGKIAFLKQAIDVQEAFSPKIDGLSVLVSLLGDAPLDFVALMSSLSASRSGPGLSDYAGANAFLDAFAESAARPPGWRNVVAFDWGVWREVGMVARNVAEAHRSAWENELRLGISPAAGQELFARILASGYGRVVVTPHDLNVPAHPDGKRDTAVDRAAKLVLDQAASPRPDLPDDFEQSATETEGRIDSVWISLHGVAKVGALDDFFELSGHSLVPTRLVARIDTTFGERLALDDIFNAPTFRQLASRIDSANSAAATAVAPKTIAVDTDREEFEF